MKTFKQFYQQLEEDAATQAAQLDAQIAAVDSELTRLTKPLNDKKMALARQKQALLPQLERERKAAEQNNKTQPGATKPGIKTPGSTGAATPGQPG
jgi:hypothetical protein